VGPETAAHKGMPEVSNPLWILAHMLGKVQLFVLQHVPKKSHDFFDKGMLQLFEMERFLIT
jgi:hypothetical protein